MSNEEEFSQNKPFVVFFRNSGEGELSLLTRGFLVSADSGNLSVKLMAQQGSTYSFEAQKIKADDILPKGNQLSLMEKISMRFEAAMRGESQRVDLRFCSGNPATRNPLHDNLHPDYAGPK